MSGSKKRLFEAVELAARAVTSNEGRVDTKHLREELDARFDDLPDHVRVVARALQIEQLVTAWKTARTPKPTGGAVLFHPSAILPLGNGLFVWMDVATADDLRAWGLLSTRNLARVAKAEATRQGYVVERLGAMRDNPGRLLGDIERDVYGWVEDDAPDLDEEFGDDEDVAE